MTPSYTTQNQQTRAVNERQVTDSFTTKKIPAEARTLSLSAIHTAILYTKTPEWIQILSMLSTKKTHISKQDTED